MSEMAGMRSSTVALLICSACCALALGQGDGDYDGDGDVDGDDFFFWAGCMTGPAGDPFDPGCEAFDFYLDFGPDGSVDMADLWAFQRAPTGPGGCTLRTKYVQASKAGSATGCFARITTRNTTLCGEPTATLVAASVAYVGVTKYVGQNPENWKWAQTGYFRRRNAGSTTIIRQIYAETKATSGPGVDDLDVNPWPGPGSHDYSCYLIGQLFGTWRFEFDGIPWHQFTHPSWEGVTGTRYHWVAEIFNKEDQMVGTDQSKCEFIQCKFIVDWGGFQNANIQEADLYTDDAGEWGIEPGFNATQFRVWDKIP